MEKINSFIATQTENGFQIVFEDSNKSPLNITFEDFDQFANKYNQQTLAGKKLELNDKDELILSLWQMVLIPDTTIH